MMAAKAVPHSVASPVSEAMPAFSSRFVYESVTARGQRNRFQVARNETTATSAAIGRPRVMQVRAKSGHSDAPSVRSCSTPGLSPSKNSLKARMAQPQANAGRMRAP